MNDLVITHNGQPAVSQHTLAQNANTEEKSIQQLIRSHKTELEKFGKVKFDEIVVKAGNGSTKRKLYYLNEQQSYLFITFLKNTKVVKEFKIQLIKEFFKMKEALDQISQTDEINELKKIIMAQNKLIANQPQVLLEDKGTINIFNEEMQRMREELEKHKELTSHYGQMAGLQIKRITIYRDTEEMLTILRSALIKDVSKLSDDDNRREAFLIVIEQLAKALLMFKEVELKTNEEVDQLHGQIKNIMCSY